MKKAYLVHFRDDGFHFAAPSLIFADGVFEVAMKNREATKIEEINCWIVPGQLKEE
jgi:hypothetical protein